MIVEVTGTPFGISNTTARAVCELLGVDPSTTARIVLTPGFAEVTSLVLVADDATDATEEGQ